MSFRDDLKTVLNGWNPPTLHKSELASVHWIAANLSGRFADEHDLETEFRRAKNSAIWAHSQRNGKIAFLDPFWTKKPCSHSVYTQSSKTKSELLRARSRSASETVLIAFQSEQKRKKIRLYSAAASSRQGERGALLRWAI